MAILVRSVKLPKMGGVMEVELRMPLFLVPPFRVKQVIQGAGKETNRRTAINKSLNPAYGAPLKIPKGLKLLGKFGRNIFTFW